MFEALKAAGKIRSNVDTAAAGRAVASVLFEFSTPEALERLYRDLRFVVSALTPKA